MAREVCDDSTKAGWGIWAYREYRRLLDGELMAVCRTYAEVKVADLPVREREEAQGWLTSAYQEAKRAREHMGECVKGIKMLRPHQAEGAGTKPWEQAEEAAARARLQAARAVGTPEYLSWRKEWMLGPGRREAASKETLPARVHPAEPR
jgi:hypothetical protein